jgi:hypothetical protein
MAVQIPFILSLIKRQYLKKVHTDTHQPANVFVQVLNVKKTRTGKILYGQGTFFQTTSPGTSGTFLYFPTPALQYTFICIEL